MRCQVSVSLEFDEAAPLTWRGEVSATAASTVVNRAVRQAQAAYPGRRWRSLVVVVLERLEDAVSDAPDAVDAENGSGVEAQADRGRVPPVELRRSSQAQL